MNAEQLEKDLETSIFGGLRQEVSRRWKEERFLDQGYPFVARPNTKYPHEWVGYESYMQAQLLKAVPGEIGVLLVNFPPETSEDNELHIHPVSDRVITVLAGSGEFVRHWKGATEGFPLVRGSRVWMPRGILHTFRSGSEGLLVESIHNPFVGLEDPKCLIYPNPK